MLGPKYSIYCLIKLVVHLLGVQQHSILRKSIKGPPFFFRQSRITLPCIKNVAHRIHASRPLFQQLNLEVILNQCGMPLLKLDLVISNPPSCGYCDNARCKRCKRLPTKRRPSNTQATFPCSVSMLTLVPASISAALASTRRTIWLIMSSSST